MRRSPFGMMAFMRRVKELMLSVGGLAVIVRRYALLRESARSACAEQAGTTRRDETGVRWGTAGAEVGIALVQSSPWISLTGGLLSTRICHLAGRRPEKGGDRMRARWVDFPHEDFMPAAP